MVKGHCIMSQDLAIRPHNGAHIPNMPGMLQPALLKREQLALAISVSPRSVDNSTKDRRISCIKISTRCVRFHLLSVLAALRKFEVREFGRRE